MSSLVPNPDAGAGQIGSPEDRATARQQIPRTAKIIYNNGFNVLDCVVTNVSATGARLDTKTFVELPKTFTLKFEDGKTRNARIVWSKVSDHGVTFIDGLGPDTSTDLAAALLSRIETIERELDELRNELLIHFNA